MDETPAIDVPAICRAALAQEGDAIRFEGRWSGWADVRRIAQAVERALTASAIAADAPVAFAPRNTPGSLAAFLPLLAQRRRIVMAYPFQSAEALAKMVGTLQAAALIMDRGDFTPPVMAAMAKAGMAGIALGDDGAELLAPGGGTCAPQPPAVVLLTSGTTGPPKHFPIGYGVIAGYIAQGLAQAKADAMRPTSLLCFPLSNVTGLYSIATSFLCGQKVVLLERFSVEGWRDYVVEYRPVAGGGPPASLSMILQRRIPRGDLASLRVFSTGAAPVDAGVRERFEETYGIPVVQTYGATEFGGPVCAMTPDLLRRYGKAKSASVGRPFGGAQIRIRQSDGGSLADRGEVGLVEVVSPRMGTDWIATSDLGSIDADGFLFLHGRADGAIMRGGFKIVPETVEAAMLAHPDIAEIAVLGLPDERLHELPVAAVVPAQGCAAPTPQMLDQYARACLPATHVPARWAIVDALPRTVSFKTDRAAVREICEAQAVSPGR